ncbi:MAG: hypothetical protein COX57_05965 [Alphaproteobacteria bacterium CG_4_10_14_0_2_um_filter_63_37]|nr:MAG: hypothetical protein AUJ55_06975 [Proteobacteria bacterium CG1_02_64_396]PJA24860.1 MAG: hypothetical protein COX57_05965 [Alphaproteobacteria bacterium CG_4_10_14_0_2_um_filter_63_37]
MRHSLIAWAGALAMSVAIVAPANAGKTVATGAGDVEIPKQAKKCMACHNFDKGAGTKVGPELYGLFNAPSTIQGGGWSWTAENLHLWLNKEKGGPKEAIKVLTGNAGATTKMGFNGFKDDAEINEVVDFLSKLHD